MFGTKQNSKDSRVDEPRGDENSKEEEIVTTRVEVEDRQVVIITEYKSPSGQLTRPPEKVVLPRPGGGGGSGGGKGTEEKKHGHARHQQDQRPHPHQHLRSVELLKAHEHTQPHTVTLAVPGPSPLTGRISLKEKQLLGNTSASDRARSSNREADAPLAAAKPSSPFNMTPVTMQPVK